MTDAVGPDVVGWGVGTRVGVGWFGGHCGHCEPRRRGDLVDYRNLKIPGVNMDGGYAEAMIAPADALEQAPAPFDKMMRNEARFRMVLTTGL